MYNLLKLTSRKLILQEIPSLSISLVLAETFFKFGSFTLETISFFISWYLLSFITDKIVNKHK